MKPTPEVLSVIQLTFILWGPYFCNGQQGNDNGQYYYNNVNHQDNSYDYNMNEADKIDHSCYVCQYHVLKGKAAGDANCRDPFNPSKIHKLTCSAPCAKTYHLLSETDYSIVRNCLTDCKESKDESHYVECCNDKLCNGSPAGQSRILPHFLVICTTIATLLMCR